MNKFSDICTEAFSLMSKGFSVFPVGANKKALIKWKPYQSIAADEYQILEWWKKWPNANIGIATGKISGIIVVDVDTYKGGDPRPFPKTYTVRTGRGGLQLYYQYVPGFTISANGYPQFPSVDLRSDGGYVVAPPSVTDFINDKTGEREGGKYEVVEDIPFAPFPIELFKEKKVKKSLIALVDAQSGSRNQSITSLIGKLLYALPEGEWKNEVWPAVCLINKKYAHPLPEGELKASFNSIAKKELKRRKDLTESPIQIQSDTVDGFVNVSIRKTKGGTPHRDMANVVAVLSEHPYFRDNLKYNEFKREIEYKGQPLEDEDITKMQHFMQTRAGLDNVSENVVRSAIIYYASQNKYDEAKDWLESLVWDKTSRLDNWIASSLNIDNDPYHSGVGAHWLTGMIKRIAEPGSLFDYVLVFVGPQGIGKTSFFRLIGAPWYKSYTGSLDNKDFYLTLRGAILVDLDEGATLYRAEAIKIKSIITETHDEFRAPYGRITKKYPRRFVFSMSTNDTEPFKDITGNRRYWVIESKNQVNFQWLQENRDQIFAEAYWCYKNKVAIPEIPLEEIKERQEAHLSEDPWTDLVIESVMSFYEYKVGKEDFSISVGEIYKKMFPDESLSRLTKKDEMRISGIFKKNLGLEKRRQMIEGERRWRWFITPEKIEELRKNITSTPADNSNEIRQDEIDF